MESRRIFFVAHLVSCPMASSSGLRLGRRAMPPTPTPGSGKPGVGDGAVLLEGDLVGWE